MRKCWSFKDWSVSFLPPVKLCVGGCFMSDIPSLMLCLRSRNNENRTLDWVIQTDTLHIQVLTKIKPAIHFILLAYFPGYKG